MVEDGRRLASMDFYDIITSFCKTKMLVVESFSSKDDSTIVNLFFSDGISWNIQDLQRNTYWSLKTYEKVLNS